ncbi:MAG: VOC family protein [Acidimicrobiia bacterium]|nr:VOC family protein [Acidimicrobiia bacterium]MDX2468300.1 VOC family protein [Acidimicrobiia bacterium]
MELGTFSISLSVKDMAVSREFYAKLGFEMVAGDGETWTILANQSHVVGLFHGMFEGNLLTFNPGWVGMGEQLDDFTDIRELSSALRALGIEPSNDTSGETPSGPASFSLTDPDGNAILIDQHV